MKILEDYANKKNSTEGLTQNDFSWGFPIVKNGDGINILPPYVYLAFETENGVILFEKSIKYFDNGVFNLEKVIDTETTMTFYNEKENLRIFKNLNTAITNLGNLRLE